MYKAHRAVEVVFQVALANLLPEDVLLVVEEGARVKAIKLLKERLFDNKAAARCQFYGCSLPANTLWEHRATVVYLGQITKPIAVEQCPVSHYLAQLWGSTGAVVVYAIAVSTQQKR